jgi:putative DNA primase/helicase
MSAPKQWGRALLRHERGQHKGELVACVANAVTILTCDVRWREVLAFDEFEGAVVTLKVPPWHRQDRPADPKPGLWTDANTTRLRGWLARELKLVLGKDDADSAIYVAAERRVVHPVRDWLASLQWDGTKRLDTWLPRYLGADDTPFVRAAGAKFLISACARVFAPGCKADHMLVLQGAQGIGKSTALAALVPIDAWYNDELDLESKDGKIALRGVWIIEASELASLRNAKTAAIKSFLSRRIDKYRDPYGRRDGRHPRMCVVASTTNEDAYLKDDTGNRRFWPVRVRRVDLDPCHHLTGRPPLSLRCTGRHG